MASTRDGHPGGTAGATGTLTFLFTDLEGSTRMWETDPAAAGAAIATHERLLRHVVERKGGLVVKGTGDGVMAVFSSANEAVDAAVQIQREVTHEGSVSSRIGIHTGEAELRDGDYYGVALNRCQRVMAAGHGGQILASLATKEVLALPLSEGVGLLDLGRHLLKDLPGPVHLFQVTHPDLPSEFPPLRGSETFAHNLPVQLTSFVGRSREKADVAEALRAGRLVTVTGIGGGGKSRLAVEAASDALGEHPGGVWMVELASVTEPLLVPRLVAQTVGVPEEPGRPILDSVAVSLRDAPTLLVLDNCEQLLEACAEVVDHLLRAAPTLRVLATSRERLGVPGEWVYVVPPMSIPAEDTPAPEQALAHDAIALFVQRAALADPRFRLTDEITPDVVGICRRVGGIPLAIELAAGRLGSMSVHEVADRLGSHLELPGHGDRTAAPRHQTMLATLEWSHDLLSDQERRVLAQLSAFRGSFTLDQVESVCRLDSGEIVGVVMALVDKSLVLHDPATGRYRLLEPVRLYAWDRLVEMGFQETLARNHASFFADFVETASAEAGTQDRLDRLEMEHDNLRAALRWALESGDGDLALRIGSAAWDFWKLRGHLTEGRAWLEQALDASRAAPPDVRSRALRGAGDLAANQGEVGRARDYLEQSLEIAEELGDHAGATESLTRLAAIPHREGRLGEATALFEEALARARAGGDLSRVGHILASLALLTEDQGLAERAESYADEALEIRSRTSDLYVATDALLAEGEIAINRSQWSRARRSLEEALDLARDAGFVDVVSWATAYLGKLSLAEGHVERGEQLLSEGLAMFQRLGFPVAAAWAMRHLGRAALEQENPARAFSLLSGALRIALDQVLPDVPLVLQALGELQARAGEPERAAVILGSAGAARERMGVQLPERERAAAEGAAVELRRSLGGDRFDELTARGAGMSLEEAAEYAG